MTALEFFQEGTNELLGVLGKDKFEHFRNLTIFLARLQVIGWILNKVSKQGILLYSKKLKPQHHVVGYVEFCE